MNTTAPQRAAWVNLRALDSLRGLLAAYVLAGHGRWLLWAGWEVWRRAPHSSVANALAVGSAVFRYGHEAVMVFFALSGFFIHFNAAKKFAEGQKAGFVPGEFFKRRARRLVPPYLFALFLTVVLDLIGQHLYPPLYAGSTGDALLDENFARKGYNLAAVLPTLVILPDSMGWDFGTNGPLWSLAYEIVYYLLYPGWLWLRGRSVWVAYMAGALCFSLSFVSEGFFPVSVLRHYPIWLAGAGLAEIVCARSLRVWTIPAACGAALACLAVLPPRLPHYATPMLYAAGGTSAVLMFARLPGGVSKWRISRCWELLGICSYSLYICHFPMLSMLSAMVFRSFGNRPISGWSALAGSAGVLLVCTGCFRLCERPFLPRGRQHILISPAAATLDPPG